LYLPMQFHHKGYQMAMQITKPKPKPAGPSVLAKERRGVMRGNREQITVTLPPETLNRLEGLARGAGMTRAAVLNLAIHRLLEHGL
jgi:hypothetical protein